MSETIDPRLKGIRIMLSGIRHVVPVMSSKGGVGKTVISTIISLKLAFKRLRVGLLDLDINDPNTHFVLGVDLYKSKPREEKGVLPVEINGLKYMTAAFYTLDNPAPLRGEEADNAVKELLAITNWGKLDYLIVDTPPGMGDEVLDTIELLPDPKPLIVTTPSLLSLKSIEKLMRLLEEMGLPNHRILVNMSSERNILRKEGQIIGYVGYDESLEKSMGDPSRLLRTGVSEELEPVVERLLSWLPPAM